MILSQGEKKVVATSMASTQDSTTQQKQVDKVVKEYNDIFTSPNGYLSTAQVRHSIDLTPGAPLPNGLVYRRSLLENKEIKCQIQKLLQKGHIRPSSSPCGISIVLVWKKYGTWWLYIDYRALNKIIVQNRYPIPRIDDLLDQLRGAKFFNKIDLKSGYHQVPIEQTKVFIWHDMDSISQLHCRQAWGACRSFQDPSHSGLACSNNIDRALQLHRPCQLLSQIRVGIFSYCLGPDPSDQGWWKGQICMNWVIVESIWGVKTSLMLSTGTRLIRSSTTVWDWNKCFRLCGWCHPHSTWKSYGISQWNTLRCNSQIPHLW